MAAVSQSNIHTFFAGGGGSAPPAVVSAPTPDFSGLTPSHRPTGARALTPPPAPATGAARVSTGRPNARTANTHSAIYHSLLNRWRPPHTTGHAFKVFTVEYRRSASAADTQLVDKAGGLDMVLREMWQMLPEHKRKAYEDFARKMSKDAIAGPADHKADHKAQHKRLEQEKARAAKDAQKEADRRLIWERRDAERKRKEEDKQNQDRQNLFKNHLKQRKDKVDDLQLLVEHITNNDAGRKALGLPETVALAPPEASPEPGMPPEVYADTIFVTNALERFRELTDLPPLSLQEIISVVRNRPCEQKDENDVDLSGSGDEEEQEQEQEEEEEDKEVVAMRNTLHEKLIGVITDAGLASVEGARGQMLGADLSKGTLGVIDAHSWQEILRRYIAFVADDPEKPGFHSMDAIRRVGDRMTRCSYGSLSIAERATMLAFLCAEILDSDDCKDAIDKSFDKVSDLKRQKNTERAEKEAEEKLRLATQRAKDDEEKKEGWAPWLAAQGEDTTKLPELHPQLWKTFEKEHQAEKVARDAADAADDIDDSDDDEDGPARTGSNDSSDMAIAIENEDSMSKGEYIRALREKREEMKKVKEQEQLFKEQRRARKKAKAGAAKAERDKKKTAEAKAREKEQKYDEQLRTLAPRLKELGKDRFHNRYWYFSCLPDKIFVENSQLPPDMLPAQIRKFRECDGTAAEKRQAAVDDTVEGLHHIKAATLKSILTAMKVTEYRSWPDQDDKPRLVDLIVRTTKEALCSESYLSMLVCTYRADEKPNQDFSSDEEEEEAEDEDTSPTAHRNKRAKLELEIKSPMSRNWEYYDTAAQLEELLGFLKVNGEREGLLKKELDLIKDKVLAAMDQNSQGLRRSFGRRRFAKSKTIERCATGVLMDLLTTFIASSKDNRKELDELKATLRLGSHWQDFIQPSLAVSELLGSITLRVTKEEKERRHFAEVRTGSARWNEWLQEWHSFTSNVQTESALLFSLYSLRQRAYSTLPEAKRNARSRVSDSPAAKAMMRANAESDEDDEDEDVDWSLELRGAAMSGKLMETKRLLATIRSSAEDDIAQKAIIDEADEDGKTALMLCAERGLMKQVELLLQHGADCEARDQDGWTALLVRSSSTYIAT